MSIWTQAQQENRIDAAERKAARDTMWNDAWWSTWQSDPAAVELFQTDVQQQMM